MAFGLRGRNAVLARPALSAPGSEGSLNNLWAKNKSSPAAADGYELTADDVNEILGQLRGLLQALNGAVAGTAGTELADAMVDALAAKLSISDGLAGLADDTEFVRMTVAERTKLAALNEGYKGAYASLAALASAIPAGVAGDWAILTKDSGTNATTAVWDTDNSPQEWVDTGVGPATLDWSAVTGKPSTFPPSSHTHTKSEVGLAKLWTRGADVASAATIDLTAATGDYVTVTGTTAITAITLADGEQAVVRFAAALTLTNGASLILPTGANIATAAGDVAVFRGEAGSVVRCAAYLRGNGRPLANLIASASDVRAATNNSLALTIKAIADALAEVSLTDAATIAWNMATGYDFAVTLAGNRTLGLPTNIVVGKKGRIRVAQDATGSRTLSFNSVFKFSRGTAPVLTTTASRVDYLYYDVRSATEIVISMIDDVC